MKTKFILAIAIVLFVAGLVAFDVYRNSPMIQNPKLYKKIKDELIDQLKKLLAKETALDQSSVWVYIVDLEPSQMVEYGEVLPESGQEKAWFDNLPDKLKKKLQSLES